MRPASHHGTGPTVSDMPARRAGSPGEGTAQHAHCNVAITAGCFICDDACIARQHIPGTTMDAIIMPGVFIP
ncbi:hypothetical protein BGC30_02690 [Novacetimonas hansenii]|nr:hypothetical protein BGC30_02690 [Novacetimonas hansenii]